jgi:glycosyltransferase involved in cell wall biosynthesis
MSTPTVQSPLRIVFLGPFGLHPKGTMRARALPAARALAARGHAVHVLMPPWHTPAEAGRTWQDQGVTVEYLSLGGLSVPGLGHGLIAGRMARRALALAPDVVHAFKPKAYSGLAAALLRARQVRGARFALVMDTDDWEGPGGWNDLESYSRAQRVVFARQERWGLTHADAVTVASRALEALAWSLGVPPGQVTYLPNAVEPERLPAERAGPIVHDGPPTILLYTRFHEFQLERSLAVLAAVRRAVPDVRLLVAGAGLAGEEGLFLERARALGLADAVTVHGWLAEADALALFNSVDAALVPMDDTLVNRTRSSMKLLDLLAAGLPVVAEAVGQTGEVIESGESGLLVTPGDVAGLASALVRLLGDAELRRTLGTGAASRVRTAFAWPERVVGLEAAYRRALARDPR